MNTSTAFRRIAGPTLVAAILATLAGGATLAQAEQVWARVISATPAQETTGMRSYNVVYEYGGRQYSTRMDSQPGSTIPIEVGGYGVATTSPVPPQADINPRPAAGARPDWNSVVPEPGVVVSAGAAPVYAQPAPVYAQPVPVYTQAAPVYYPAPVYVQPAYVGPYVYPPVGISLNLGYSRGWGGGWHGRWR